MAQLKPFNGGLIGLGLSVKFLMARNAMKNCFNRELRPLIGI